MKIKSNKENEYKFRKSPNRPISLGISPVRVLAERSLFIEYCWKTTVKLILQKKKNLSYLQAKSNMLSLSV